jgi:hypothetical protein
VEAIGGGLLAENLLPLGRWIVKITKSWVDAKAFAPPLMEGQDCRRN